MENLEIKTALKEGEDLFKKFNITPPNVNSLNDPYNLKPIKEELLKIASENIGVSESICKKMTLDDYDYHAKKSEEFGGINLSYMLSLVVDRLFTNAYQRTPAIAREVFTETSLVSLTQTKSIYGLDEISGFQEITNYADIKSGVPVTDWTQSLRLRQYGKRLSFRYADTINDTFDTIGRIITENGAMAIEFEDAFAFYYWSTIDSALITTALGNLTTATISQAAVEAAIQTMGALSVSMGYGDISTKSYKYNRPTILLGGPATQFIREKICTYGNSVGSSLIDQPNLVRGIMRALTTPRLTGSQWLCIADPNVIPLMYLGFYSGWNNRPVILRQTGNAEVISGSMLNVDLIDFKTLTLNYLILIAIGAVQAVPTANWKGIGVYGRIAA